MVPACVFHRFPALRREQSVPTGPFRSSYVFLISHPALSTRHNPEPPQSSASETEGVRDLLLLLFRVRQKTLRRQSVQV